MMEALVKTVVATGASSGLGFEVIKQLLGQTQPYKFILGARDVPRTRAAYANLEFDSAKHSLTVLPLELSDLADTKTFAQQALENLGPSALDYLLLNAAVMNDAKKPGPHGSKWCESYIVNHLSQYYLTHLLREKLVVSKSRVVVVSSGAATRVTDPSILDTDLKGESGADVMTVYSETKFVQLLGAHWWRRQLAGQCVVVAVSPGLIPNTGIGKGTGIKITPNMPDAKSIPEGAASILRAFTRDDFPADPDQIFLTSWGEWWSKDIYKPSLDKGLQDKWCPSKEEIEKGEGLSV
ncbi:hypothetical protein B0T17DRAFT_538678 [Bombardia bombarda]|uniref:Uncharacterized protein n=1 Tax=Bombardia bombarda TaxID=252184 RepID=A0AA39WHS2_9PEZI|nr:hypothetical protein B0T17DRAFT_538678 [Bombardia bombarda]